MMTMVGQSVRWGHTRVLGSFALAVAAGGISVVPATAQTNQSSYKVVAVNAATNTAVPAMAALHLQGARITLTVQHEAIADVLYKIASQANMALVWSQEKVPLNDKISLSLHDVSVSDALAAVLKTAPVQAKLSSDGQTILLVPKPRSTGSPNHAAQGTVTGTIVDSASGQGIVGATVSVLDSAGSRLSALTNRDGQFVLKDVPEGERMLGVRAFGFHPATRKITVSANEARSIRIVLTSVPTVLSGVVTTATGQQQKLAVGSDITTINVDSVMKTAPITSVTDLLENRVPGLTVVHTSGTPGDPSRLLLRGAASVNGTNNPIVVVDGVRIYDPDDLGGIQTGMLKVENGSNTVRTARPSPLDQIDPNTIATIEVLKGPSAAALYGSDAANGVIVITTKKGQPGQTHWSVDAMQGVSFIPGSFPELTYEFGHSTAITSERQCVGGWYPYLQTSSACIIDSVRTFQALNDPRFSPLTSGPLSRVSATVSGGASALTYSFTGSAQNTHGTTKMPSFATQKYTEAVGSSPPSWMRSPDDYVGWNGGGQVQAALSPTANLTVSDMLSSSTQHRTDLGLSAVGSMLAVYVDTTNIANTPAFTSFFTQITQATLTSTTTATLNWRVRPWFPLTVTGGYNRNQETDKQYFPSGLPATILPSKSDTTGMYDLGTNQATVATLNANTTIPIALGHGPALQLAAGTNFVSQAAAAQELFTNQVPVGVSDPTSFPQTTATRVYQTSQSAATYGWFFEPQLQFHSRFFITPGIRFDGGTASGSGAGIAAFPKTNLSYIAIDHTGESEGAGWTHVLSLLRLRGAFGIAGVQPTPGQALRLFNTPAVISLDGGAVSTSATALSTLGNTLLHPERSREMEAGFDAQFFQNRATFTATYYNKLRIDAIEAVSVAPSVVGYVSSCTLCAWNIDQNVGNIRNSGVEFTSDLLMLDTRAVTWSVNGSLSFNDNRVISSTMGSSVDNDSQCLYASQYVDGGGSIACAIPGYPLGAKFAQVVAGYADLNHDGVIESQEVTYADSLQYVGSPDPRYTMSFGTTISLWHGRLSAAMQGDFLNGMSLENPRSCAFLTSAANQAGAGLEQQVPAAAFGDCGTALFNTVNAFRLDALSINLTLPNTVAHAVHAQQATLSLQGSNLGLWTNYQGKDPLVSGAFEGLDLVDGGGLPLPRTWQLAVRITQ